MKQYLLLIILGLNMSAFSQQIQLTPSFGASTYYRIFPDEYYDNPNDLKLTTDIAIQYLHKVNFGTFSYGINFTDYSGKHLDGWYGFSGYGKTEGDFHNRSVGIQFAFIDRVFNDKFEAVYGINWNYRITSSRTGYSTYYSVSSIEPYYGLLNSEGGRKFLPFLTCGLAYPISINDQFIFVPGFKTAFGLLKEYDDYRRWSNYFSLGLRYDFTASDKK